jgi:type IV secretory pathway TraG/TraD family ATPase VirD4
MVSPHGDLVARIAARIPGSHQEKVIYLNATDPTQPYGYNPLRHVSQDRIALAASGMMDVFKKMWPDAWGVRMEHILRNVLMALLEQPEVLLVNLAKGHIGEDSSSLLGGLLVTTIGLAAFSRADTPPAERRDFFVYIDEFQNFTTLALANMLSELRKYRVGFTVAHQYLNQLEPAVRHAVLGNAGSILSFRVGVEDAPYLVREFQPKFEELDLAASEL